jgi:hypothetical protein
LTRYNNAENTQFKLPRWRWQWEKMEEPGGLKLKLQKSYTSEWKW